MEDRIAALEKHIGNLQSQIYDCQAKYQAMRAAFTYLVPEFLASHGFTPEGLHNIKESSVTTALYSTIGGASPQISDDFTKACSDEIEALYDTLAKHVADSKASVTKSPCDIADPIVQTLVASGIELSDSQLGLVAFIIRREVDAAIEAESRALLNLCDREARWTVDHPTAKLILQRIASFAKSRMETVEPSFWASISAPSGE